MICTKMYEKYDIQKLADNDSKLRVSKNDKRKPKEFKMC